VHIYAKSGHWCGADFQNVRSTNFRSWHIASFRCDAEFGRDRGIADIDCAAPIKSDLFSTRPKIPQLCSRHRRDRADPDAWHRAREEAWRNPFPGATPEACIAALDEAMRGIGDTCPDCG
jgi:hypothetical protein